MTTNRPQLAPLSDLGIQNLLQDFYITQHGVYNRVDLFAHAYAFSKQLPEKTYAVNICQNRYLFIVAYLAVMLRQQITLLPPNQSQRTLSDLLTTYTPAYCITDDLSASLQHHTVMINQTQLSRDTATFPTVELDRTLSISFTSGSAGKPKAITKSWREFQLSAHLALQQLALRDKAITLVSTVPPQHMYGLETSLFWPLFSTMRVQDSRPFFPIDVQTCLQASATPSLLVSTPTHLKACINSHINWPPVAMALSSTAPMAPYLALQIERQFKAPLYELLGSTETLSFASRQPVQTGQWQPYQGIELSQSAGNFILKGGHLLQPVPLDDTFLLGEDGTFSLQGRSTDLIKIAGKRASLTELNHLLNTINGIEEGIFFCDKHERLSIIIVSDLPQATIRQVLKQSLDPVFLPRRIIRTAAIPRNATGKLLKNEIDALTQGLAFV